MVLSLDERRDRFDPGFSRRRRCDGVGGRDRVGNGVNEVAIWLAGFRQMIDGLMFVEAGHFDRKFDRRVRSVDTQ